MTWMNSDMAPRGKFIKPPYPHYDESGLLDPP